ncbi:DUF1707 SHOCT-like domain-containing protein [Actinomadura algeriensis]|uniref:Cell wall-active antibiotic response 4TMS protein YvqF n=1 Tax=Actinomadura algeriensis TaxID=1679523 RepID=A0ABR9JXK3_9ACTN|nr:DUF1707 domain-containing protein [Actinomadura algeriensis]MBE1535300.1 hypothetical protein [Actinomadura algeriensis]
MNLPEHPSGQDPARLRASDADRDDVADRLREALAEGRITAEEHAERIDAAYRAKTYADLEPLLSDLPSGTAPGPRVNLRKQDEPAAPPTAQSASVVAVLSGATRSGRWLVEQRTNVVSLLGGIELDFRQAVLSASEVTVNVTAVLGGVAVTVPPGVRVVDSTMAILGATTLPEDDVIDPDAPVIRLTGMVLLSGVTVERKEAGKADSRHDRLEERHRRAMGHHADWKHRPVERRHEHD